MKKILILILIALLGLVIYMLVCKNIEVASYRTTNLEELKALKDSLDKDITLARELNEKEYTSNIDELEKSIRTLKTTKNTYETKLQYLNEDLELGIIKVKEYKIEYLWAVIQNYARDEGVTIKLDLVENGTSNLYNLDMTVKGGYQEITNFVQSIENDDTLDFKIEDFKITPQTTSTSGTSTSGTSTSGTTTVVADTRTLQATFIIRNVKIGLN